MFFIQISVSFIATLTRYRHNNARPSLSLMCSLQSEINAPLKGTGFACTLVSWEDSMRDVDANGELSHFGDNIADVGVETDEAMPLYTVRGDNYREMLGETSADRVILTVNEGQRISNIKLHTLLQDIPRFFPQHGVQTKSLYAHPLDTSVSIRFQTVFVPLQSGQPYVQYTPWIYSYNTPSEQDPRNMVLTSTSQGTSMVMDKPCKQRLWLQMRQNNEVTNQWYRAEPTRHVVGQAQHETTEEKLQLAARGKATSCAIGVPELGNRFNCFVTVQVPLKQQRRIYYHTPSETNFCMMSLDLSPLYRSIGGTSSAARVSVGSQARKKFTPCPISIVERDPKALITVSVTTYNVVDGSGIPKPEDVKAAVSDLQALYKAYDMTPLHKESKFVNQEPAFTFFPVDTQHMEQ